MTLTVYCKPQCPFCDKTKRYLDNHNIAFREVNIEQDGTALEFMQQQGLKTVPQIFMDGKIFVEGGWSGLSNMTAADILSEIELRNSLADQTL